MKTYEQKKNAAREKAIYWQELMSLGCWSYEAIARCQRKAEALAKKYGLTREFRENGII